jgi:hypothetical protein
MGCTDAALVVEGTATLENTLVADGGDGIRVADSGTQQGTVTLTYTTIAGNAGTGVDNTVGGTVTIDKSIVFNGGPIDDLIGVPCGNVTWSLIGSPDCSSHDDNLPPQDPLFDADDHLLDGSPCIEHGPDPALYTGDPLTDGDGEPRLRDFDGDGYANNDCGAYERAPNDPNLAPEVKNLRWDNDKITLRWDNEPLAVEYHIYRDFLTNLSYANFGVCRNDLDPDRTDDLLSDTEDPAPGQGFSYLVTAEIGSGDEGTLGLAAGAERSNFCPCSSPCP